MVYRSLAGFGIGGVDGGFQSVTLNVLDAGKPMTATTRNSRKMVAMGSVKIGSGYSCAGAQCYHLTMATALLSERNTATILTASGWAVCVELPDRDQPLLGTPSSCLFSTAPPTPITISAGLWPRARSRRRSALLLGTITVGRRRLADGGRFDRRDSRCSAVCAATSHDLLR